MTFTADKDKLVAFSITFILAGAASLIVRKKRRDDDVQHCLKCDYNLTGLTSRRCPECGEPFAQQSITNKSRTRPVKRYRRGLGMGLMLIGLVLLAGSVRETFRNFRWIEYKPFSWIVKDLDSKSTTVADIVWKEIQRRLAASSVSTASRNQLVIKALSDQRTTPGHSYDYELFTFLGQEFKAHHLTDNQQREFYDWALRVSIVLPPRVGKLDEIPIVLERSSGRPYDFSTILTVVSYRLDDGPMMPSDLTNYQGLAMDLGQQCGYLAPMPIGKHRIEMTIHIRTIDYFKSGIQFKGPYDTEVTKVFAAEFESVAGHVDNPDPHKQMLESLPFWWSLKVVLPVTTK